MFLRKNGEEKCDVPPLLTAPIKEISHDRPVMVYDGDCGFCQRWILRWQKITGDKIQYVPYQFFAIDDKEKLRDFPKISIDDCRKAVQFALPDGTPVFRT